jgi:hypothetical protein
MILQMVAFLDIGSLLIRGPPRKLDLDDFIHINDEQM